MRLANVQFEFRRDGAGLKCCLPDRAKPLACIVPDERHAGMWRVVRRDGSLSDMVNLTRAKDAARGIALWIDARGWAPVGCMTAPNVIPLWPYAEARRIAALEAMFAVAMRELDGPAIDALQADIVARLLECRLRRLFPEIINPRQTAKELQHGKD
jgi:hypothetical protein